METPPSEEESEGMGVRVEGETREHLCVVCLEEETLSLVQHVSLSARDASTSILEALEAVVAALLAVAGCSEVESPTTAGACLFVGTCITVGRARCAVAADIQSQDIMTLAALETVVAVQIVVEQCADLLGASAGYSQTSDIPPQAGFALCGVHVVAESAVLSARLAHSVNYHHALLAYFTDPSVGARSTVWLAWGARAIWELVVAVVVAPYAHFPFCRLALAALRSALAAMAMFVQVLSHVTPHALAVGRGGSAPLSEQVTLALGVEVVAAAAQSARSARLALHTPLAARLALEGEWIDSPSEVTDNAPPTEVVGEVVAAGNALRL